MPEDSLFGLQQNQAPSLQTGPGKSQPQIVQNLQIVLRFHNFLHKNKKPAIRFDEHAS